MAGEPRALLCAVERHGQLAGQLLGQYIGPPASGRDKDNDGSGPKVQFKVCDLCGKFQQYADVAGNWDSYGKDRVRAQHVGATTPVIANLYRHRYSE